ncbi:hypothetical protein C6497_06160 [Candidatus Poribacteria bacterium]|nr:MAG: hypothetical protein C6497_06160 [Candidatus Poribacteria bacterium]
MRAGVLGNERVIKFLNDNFINTWVSNFESGRKPSYREYIAKRYDGNAKSFDTNNALAQAIKEGWHESSPVDCFVISPDFEMIGKLPLNKYLYDGHDWDGGRTRAENYRLFLIESIERKYPGFNTDNSFAYLIEDGEDTQEQENSLNPYITGLNVVLNSQQSTLDVVDVVRTHKAGFQQSTIINIDTTAFENGGTLTIDIRFGSAEFFTSCYLYEGDIQFPQERGQRYDQSIANATDIPQNGTAKISYPFYHSQHFRLALAVSEIMESKDSVNAFQARISVE